jgi:hypothetical protein
VNEKQKDMNITIANITMESKNANQAFFAENSPKCSHGFPHSRTIDDEHQKGARIIMKWLREQNKKEATGKLAAESKVGFIAMRFMEGYPELADQTTINMLIQLATDVVFLGGTGPLWRDYCARLLLLWKIGGRRTPTGPAALVRMRKIWL